MSGTRRFQRVHSGDRTEFRHQLAPNFRLFDRLVQGWGPFWKRDQLTTISLINQPPTNRRHQSVKVCRTEYDCAGTVHLSQFVEGERELGDVHNYKDVSRTLTGRTHAQITHGFHGTGRPSTGWGRSCLSAGAGPSDRRLDECSDTAASFRY
ncbi:MAG: hypothetical protein CL467_08800 [Acidimicrobiaceae bacterium]|nr:hypothetical protein [Acidimicrobiaceae bacterium]